MFGWIAQVAGSWDEDMAKCWSSLPIETGASSLWWTLIFGIFLLNAHPSLSRINSCIRSQHKVLNTWLLSMPWHSELNVLEILAGQYACAIFITMLILKSYHFWYTIVTATIQANCNKKIQNWQNKFLKVFLREKEGFNLHDMSLLLIHDIDKRLLKFWRKDKEVPARMQIWWFLSQL